MYCNSCGKQIQDDANLCAYCGRRVGYVAAEPQKLMRPPKNSPDRKIAGVCASFAEYFDLDVTIVRVVWLIVALFGGGGVLAYIIAWIVMPEAPELAMVPATPMPQPYHQ
jgi:phage shock protein C